MLFDGSSPPWLTEREGFFTLGREREATFTLGPLATRQAGVSSTPLRTTAFRGRRGDGGEQAPVFFPDRGLQRLTGIGHAGEPCAVRADGAGVAVEDASASALQVMP